MQDLAAHIDSETRSRTDLNKSGVYRYVEDPSTDVWGFSWRLGQYGPVRQWRPGYADPVELLEHIRNGGKVVAHNIAFDRTIWNYIIRRWRPHWPLIAIEQCDCTMARAAAIAHPQKLEDLCRVLNTTNQKDMEGHNLMLKMARPRRIEADGRVVWWDEPALIDRNMAYCDKDVLTETDIDDRIPQLTERQRADWLFDQHINERGVCVDMKAVRLCLDVVEIAKKEADRTMRRLTGRTVPKCTNVGKIIDFLNARGIETETLKKGDQDDLRFLADLRGDHTAKDVISLRKASSKTSTSKYKSMTACVSSDNRIRGMINWHGASTGRRAGRLVQPQNLVRVDPDDKVLATKIAWLHDLIQSNNDARQVYDYIEAVYGPLEPLDLLSRALRSMFVAATGNKLVGGDFANIEGRVNAWLAGEHWKLQAFADYDAGIGPDLYKVAYSRAFGVPVESVGKGQKRQIGKVQELALGYQGGIGAILTMGDTYMLNVYELTDPVRKASTPEQWYAMQQLYNKPGTDRKDLKEPEWVACKIIVTNWRNSNQAIVQSWWDRADAAIAAVAEPGTIQSCLMGRVQYYADGRCLWATLPSGRMLCYSAPEIEISTKIVEGKNGPYERIERKVLFWGTDSKTKQWRRKALYGGLQCENDVQAISCDILVDAMFNVERAGFPVILTVHDEILAEIEANSARGEREFNAAMSMLAPEYEGLPLAVSAWEDVRYVK